MDKFSKFFPNDEVQEVIVNRESKYLYVWYLLELVAIFFFLFPLWHLGRYGVLLWLTIFIACLVFFANYLLRRNTIYILTKYKIWHVFYVNDSNIKLRGAINISEIENITRSGNDLHIKTDKVVHNLKNLKNIDRLSSLLTREDRSILKTNAT